MLNSQKQVTQPRKSHFAGLSIVRFRYNHDLIRYLLLLRGLLALLLLAAVVVRVGVGQVVDGDGQEYVEEDVVAGDEEDDEVEAEEHPVRLDAAKGLDAVVHHHVPILARQDLQRVVGIGVTQYH